MMNRIIMFASVALVFLFGLSPTAALFVSNLDAACMKCLCIASTDCDPRFECSSEGFCGPFFISRQYWEHAGRVTRNPSTASSLDAGYMDCVKNYECASTVVTNYMAETGWDCNDDGVTDCDDYARIHYYGPEKCSMASFKSTVFYANYTKCRPPKWAIDS